MSKKIISFFFVYQELTYFEKVWQVEDGAKDFQVPEQKT